MIEYRPGYWRIVRELFEAAALAGLAVALYIAIKLGFVFLNIEAEKSSFAERMLDGFGGALMAAGMGYLLFLPILFAVVLFVGAPVAKTMYWREWDSLRAFVVTGALMAFMVLCVIPLISSDKPFSFDKLFGGGIVFASTGALTGFLFHRKMQKVIAAKLLAQDS